MATDLQTELTLTPGSTKTLKAVITPNNSTRYVVSWETIDNNFVKFDKIGENIRVSAVNPGTVSVKAVVRQYHIYEGVKQLEVRTFSHTCVVTVVPNYSAMSISEFSKYLTDKWSKMSVIERMKALNYAYGQGGPYAKFKKISRYERAYEDSTLKTAFSGSTVANQGMLSSAKIDPNTGIIYVTKSDIKNTDGSLAKIYLVAAPYAMSSVGTGSPKTGGIFKLSKNGNASYICIADSKDDTPFSYADTPDRFPNGKQKDMSPFGGASKTDNGWENPDVIEGIVGYYSTTKSASMQAADIYRAQNPGLNLSDSDRDKIAQNIYNNYTQGGIGRDISIMNWESISYVDSYY